MNSAVPYWYASLQKPAITPPNFIFGPVWSVLYAMFGWVLGGIFKVWRQNKKIFFIILLHLILNLSWSPAFFYYKQIDIAFYIIILMLTSLLAFFFMKKTEVMWNLQLIPYFLWIFFASFLNFWIWHLN
jgi:tryptophan-rich sensory protein